MKAKVVEDADVVTYVVVCDPGDEAVSAALAWFATAPASERRARQAADRGYHGMAGTAVAAWTG